MENRTGVEICKPMFVVLRDIIDWQPVELLNYRCNMSILSMICDYT